MRKIDFREHTKHLQDEERGNEILQLNITETYYWWVIDEFKLNQYKLRHVENVFYN